MGELIEIRDLKKYFPIESGFIRKVRVDLKAVDGVSFGIEEGETFGLVGESGCGKTTIGKVTRVLFQDARFLSIRARIYLLVRGILCLESMKIHENRRPDFDKLQNFKGTRINGL